MLKNSVSGLSATGLRIVLFVSMFLLVALGSVAFWFGCQQLTKYSLEVSSVNAQVASSTENLATLKKLEAYLATNNDAVNRAKGVVAESTSYQYQDKIIEDINTYARRAGIGIAGYSFAGGGAAGAATTPSASTADTAAPTPTATGLKSTNVSVTLKSGTSYESIMRFIHFIEQNLTKMQLSGVSLAKDQQTNEVTSNALTIEVYTR